MADSIGGPIFPRTGIQEGHLHFDKENNILWVYNGGLASDITNWSIVGGNGSVGGGFQRWPWKITGTEMSIGFGVQGEQEFIVPASGTITGWAVIIGSASPTPVEFDVVLTNDPFGGADTIDTITVPISSLEFISERGLSFAVVEGGVLSVLQQTQFDPAVHDVKMSGYIDFTPS